MIINTLILGSTFAAGIVVGLFLAEEGVLTAGDIRRAGKYVVDKKGVFRDNRVRTVFDLGQKPHTEAE